MNKLNLRQIDINNEGDSAEELRFGEISSIARLVNTTSTQIGNYLINGKLYEFEGRILMEEIEYLDGENSKIDIWAHSYINFYGGLNAMLDRKDTFMFTQEELEIVLALPEVVLHTYDIEDQLGPELGSKYKMYIQFYTQINHDLHHFLLTNKSRKIVAGTTFMDQTKDLVSQMFFVEEYGYAKLRRNMAFEESAKEEFSTSIAMNHTFSNETILCLHEILTKNLTKFIRNSDEDIGKINKLLESEEYKHFVLAVDKIFISAIEHTRYLIDLLMQCEGKDDWRKRLVQNLFEGNDELKKGFLEDDELNGDLASELDDTSDLNSFPCRIGLMSKILNVIGELFKCSLIYKNPIEAEILYKGKQDYYFPPIFQSTKEGKQDFANFQIGILGILEKEHEKISNKKTSREIPC